MAYEKLKSENYSNLGGINTKVSPYLTGVNELLRCVNLDYSQPGALSQRPGTTQAIGTTLTGRLTTHYEYERLSGFSQMILTANTNAYSVVVGGIPQAFKTGLTNGLQFDFVTFVDRLFGANGSEFFRWDGTNVSSFSLPPGMTASWGVTAVIGGSMLPGGATGIFIAAYGYVNDRGYRGPPSNGITLILSGATFNSFTYYGLTQMPGYGITAIALYRTSGGGVDLTGTTFAVTGSTQVTDIGFPLTTTLANDYMWFTLAPRYMDIVNNQLFMAGFSNSLSTIKWSDIGEPEGLEAAWTNEVRTNDGDRITGVRAYNGDGLVFKERSFTKFRANSPNDVQFVEISDQYGALSDRAIAVYKSICLFLDRKGIVEFAGAEPKIISDRVEGTFMAMNIDAARDQACAIHNRLRNEIWFAIPVSGATLNNCIVVYDYLANAWATWYGPKASYLSLMRGGTSTQRAFYSDYQGTLYNFGSSLTGDSGAGMTCLFQTRFVNDLGDSVEKLYRQFYLNYVSNNGATVGVTVSLFTNYGTVSELTLPMYLNPFQSRIDFGISAKSISAEVSSYSATTVLKFPGFTFKYRFLRNS